MKYKKCINCIEYMCKLKYDELYLKLKMEREKLIKQYESNGVIRYDVACGIVGIVDNKLVKRRKDINVYREDGSIITEPNKENLDIFITGTSTRSVLDFDTICAENKKDGIISGTMSDCRIICG